MIKFRFYFVNVDSLIEFKQKQIMREVVQVNFGQWGNKVGDSFWQTIGQEHSVGLDGCYFGQHDDELLNIGVHYNQIEDNKFVPRCVFTDLDPRSNDAVLSGSTGGLYSLDSFVSGVGGTNGNWAKGHYTDYYDVLSFMMDKIRKELEAWDWFQGFQLNYSISGGTGSGLGARAISELRCDYPDRLLENYIVFPSSNIHYSSVEPYNSLLSLHQIIENCDFVNVIQNESLYNISSRSFRLLNPSLDDLNYLIGLQMADISASVRFGASQATNLRKMLVNLCPFPRLHFYMSSSSPLDCLSAQSVCRPAESAAAAVQNMFSDN